MFSRTERRQSGLTLVELIVFIVIVGVGVAGITITYNTVVRGSVDPMVRKQALVIAESLLLEIEQQAFTWCDPQDVAVTTATSAAMCAVGQNSVTGPSPASEQRGDTADPFDNVADYGEYGVAVPVTGRDIVGGNVNADYAVTVRIAQAGGVAPFAALPADAVLRIAVRVVGRGEDVTLVGYRTRYAPNSAG